MISRASDYIPIANEIRDRAVEAKLEVERLHLTQNKLDHQQVQLNQTISFLDASIEAEKCRLQEEQDYSPDANQRLESLRCQRETSKRELQNVIRQLDVIQEELAVAEAEAAAAEAKKLQALIEVQSQARITEDNSRKLQGMVGPFAGAGSAGIGVLQQRYANLQQAASILGDALSAGSSMRTTAPSASIWKPAATQRGYNTANTFTSTNPSAEKTTGASRIPEQKSNKPISDFPLKKSTKKERSTARKGSHLSKKAHNAKFPKCATFTGKQKTYTYSPKSTTPKTKWHFFPPHILSTAYKFPYLERRYGGSVTFTNPETGSKETAMINRRIYQFEGFDPEMVIPPGVYPGHGRIHRPTTNLELMLSGNGPLVKVSDENGNEMLVKLELHHVTGEETLHGSSYFNIAETDGALMEIPYKIHKQYDKQLHIQGLPSFRKPIKNKYVDSPNSKSKGEKSPPSADNNKYNEFREQYWISRALEYLSNKHPGTTINTQCTVYPALY
jgi:hypothetical protein